MDFADHVAAIRSEGAALGRAAAAAGLDAAVPGCPGWRVADLVGHVGRLHSWVAALVTERPDAEPDLFNDIVVPDGAGLLDWYDAGVEPLATALEAAGPAAEVWSWTDTHTAGFWARRQAHETAVHRWDAECAADGARAGVARSGSDSSSDRAAVTPVGAALAVDGIDEAFDMAAFRSGTKDLRGTGESIHLHCTDGDGEWLVRLDESGVTVTREHAKGDVAARGTASDLLLLLYNRIPADALDVFGDAALLARWQHDARF